LGMSEAEGIGDILTGGIIAREVDGAHGGTGHDPHEGAGGTCLNCGAVRSGPFCQGCGQSGHIHRNVAALGHDILHGVFHFEGKFWTTLPMLAFHPGELTRRYIRGERAKFVSPMALFLFSVFLLFAAVNRISAPDVAGASQGLAKARVQLSDETEKARDRLQDIQEKRTEALAERPNADVRAIDKQIADAQEEVAGLAQAQAYVPAKLSDVPGKVPDVPGGAAIEKLSQGKVDTGSSALDTQIRHVRDNPALYAYKLKMASYKFSWALIPISVPFIWLLFWWRRDVGFYDHAIFAIHSLSFMTLLVVGLIVLYLVGIPQAWLWLALLIVPPIHIYRQLKDAYRIGRVGALWRTPTLLVMTSISSMLFFLLLLWLEAE
jgi:hypothetical protein